MGKRINTATWMEAQNRWQIKVQKDGVRKTFYSSTPGRKGQREANAKADTWLDDGIENQNLRVSALLEGYFKDLQERTSKSNWRPDMVRCNKWITPKIGMKKVGSINNQDLQNVINKAYAEGNLSRKSLMNLRNIMVGFFKYCRKRRVTTFVPEDITIPQGARVGQKKILQPEDLVVLFTEQKSVYYGKEIENPYIHAFRFSVLTGLRPGELVGLNWEDISGNTIRIQRSINVCGETTAGKNQNAVRSFILPPSAMQVLEAQRKLCTVGSVFRIWTERDFRNWWKRFCDTNHIPYVPPYNLRHTFVSLAKNLSESQVKDIVGHSKNMDTFGVYSHEMRGDQERTAMDLENIIRDIVGIPERKL